VALLVVSAIPFSLGGVLVPRWEEVHVEGSTTTWDRTAAYPGSILLFTLGGMLSLAGVVLTPIGAVRLARSSSAQVRRSWLATLSPFAAPSTEGGAIIGLSGSFF
jgi:hypothetical protein